MPIINTSEKVLSLFNGYEAGGYQSPILFQAPEIGFSIQKNYPENIRYKPAKTRNGKDDNIAVIWVSLGADAVDNNLTPLRLRVANMSLYRAKHWDYNFDEDDSPTEESVIASRKTPQPLELNWIGGVFYDQQHNVLKDESNNIITGVAVLNKIFSAHCDTVHPIKGLPIKTLNRVHNCARGILDLLVASVIFILRKLFGRTIDENGAKMSYFSGYEWENFKKISIDSIELAGYRASKNVIVIFSIITVFASFLILPTKEDTYVHSLINSETLMILHIIVGLYLLDDLIPSALFMLLNLLIKVRTWYVRNFMAR